jgi:hypothetical protein
MEADINEFKGQLKDIIKNPNTRVLLKTRPVLNQTLNFDILCHMLDGKRKKASKGIMLTLFRAHPYISNLLSKRKIEINGLTFIDPLYSISGDTRPYSDKAIILSCPFSRSFEENLFEALELVGKIDFVLIDDVCTLLNYWRFDRIEGFLEQLSKRLVGLGDPTMVIVADCTKDKKILEAAGTICDKVIEVNGIKKKKTVKKRVKKKGA